VDSVVLPISNALRANSFPDFFFAALELLVTRGVRSSE
jgi:hypothetical protein